MNFITVVALAIVIVLVQASPARIRRNEQISEFYCLKHLEHYNRFCGDDAGPIERSLFGKVAKFCPAYEKHCAVGKAGLVELPDLGAPLVMPPVLPRGSDFASLDLPIADDRKPAHVSTRTQPQTTRLTTAIVATCTPECTATHCTDECKCAHTHPKVHQMCNPPSSAAMAETCQRWYSKCTMFTPVQY
ncbi:unnamed protein product [Caenorhabditis sp. 36 PRJEB53466]|nr:unnamed protein product [Caenorhabditis sp. 36 PRJEB53466]